MVSSLRLWCHRSHLWAKPSQAAHLQGVTRRQHTQCVVTLLAVRLALVQVRKQEVSIPLQNPNLPVHSDAAIQLIAA